MGEKKNITKTTLDYIRQHPSITDCMTKGLINYSALARRIAKAQSLDSVAAVQIACRRVAETLAEPSEHDATIFRLIKQAKLNIRSPMLSATVAKPLDFKKLIKLRETVKEGRGDINIIEGEEVFTVVTNEQYRSTICQSFTSELVNLKESLVQITMLFNEEIKTVPGIVATVYSLLRDKNVNILEEMSCWTDLMLVVQSDDIEKVLLALKRVDKEDELIQEATAVGFNALY